MSSPDRPLRVLHCPSNVGNHPQELARAERALGLESWCVTLGHPPFEYRVDEVVDHSDFLRFETRRWLLLRRAMRQYDIVHFNFGSSLFPRLPPRLISRRHLSDDLIRLPGRLYATVLGMRDLDLLRRAGKGIVVTFQGDDARQGTALPDAEERRALLRETGEDYYTPAGDAAKRRMIGVFERTADRIYYVNPDLAPFLPVSARFVPYAHVDPVTWRPPASSPGKATVTIVHAPSHRGIKGTRIILETVSRLQRDRLPVELVLVEDRSHADARRAYEQADLAIDQLLVGWYGGVAVELMALSKPVVCHIDDERVSPYLPAGMLNELPVIRATRHSLYDVLIEWLRARRAELVEVGARGRAFVEAWHDPAKIARQLERDYRAICRQDAPTEPGGA